MECLITKLKGVVSDSTLPVLGRMYISVSQQDSPDKNSQKLVITSSESQTISVEGGQANLTLNEDMATELTNSIELTPNVETTVYCKNGNYRIIIPNKYAIIRIGKFESTIGGTALSLNIDDFKYANNFKGLYLDKASGVYGNLSSMKGKPINILSPLNNVTVKISDLNEIHWEEWVGYVGIACNENSVITGSLSDLIHTDYSDKVTRLSLQVQNEKCNLVGDIATLASVFPNLTSLDLSGVTMYKNKIGGDIGDLTMPLSVLAIYNSNIQGSIESFVKTQRAQGRTSGSCGNGGWWGNKITFKGNPIDKSTKDTLSWTATQITCADETITA